MMHHGRFHRALVKVLSALCAVLFAALVLDVLWGVFTRQVLNDQPAWTDELARFLLVWLALLGGVLAYADDRHLGVDVLVSRLDPAAQRIALLVSHLGVFGFSLAVLVAGGVELFVSRWEAGQMMSALDIRKAWFYLVLPLAGSLITLMAGGKVIRSLKSFGERGEAR
ncbi:TRAP-type C4-dicarboxylate transport system permease small subunit [Haloferula luteola]|uniref:TRAP-type C4-dicarboxylate transport system permease small subunit n=1 Tax=Haloferula luteola TaxID=595692 RepID=A0A840V3S0_9BACT|nr:TRAP transporter small permease [Haloferula luteola]MBB5351696.1 TRAP-type C4-dicarboxylate transport system permease small subunit [Haloferula luteola]